MSGLQRSETVRSAGRRLRDLLLAGASAIERRAGTGRVSARDGTTPFDNVDPAVVETIFARLRVDPMQLLQIANVRKDLARARVKQLIAQNKLRQMDEGDKVSHNTIGHNYEQVLEKADMDRPIIMVNAVKSIQSVINNVGNLDVLTIGPRSEIEIFALLAAGFNADRISGLDLFSYSPYIDIGDMHAMPYADNSFDVVFVGWVLSYSRDQQAAAREILRVARDGAILVIAGDYSDENTDRTKFEDDTTHMQNCAQIEALFPGNVGHVYFRNDPRPPETTMVMSVFEVKK
jgi:SAM-dependent methyltransferase